LIKLDKSPVWENLLYPDRNKEIDGLRSNPKPKRRRQRSVARNVKSSVARFEDCPVEEDLER